MSMLPTSREIFRSGAPENIFRQMTSAPPPPPHTHTHKIVPYAHDHKRLKIYQIENQIAYDFNADWHTSWNIFIPKGWSQKLNELVWSSTTVTFELQTYPTVSLFFFFFFFLYALPTFLKFCKYTWRETITFQKKGLLTIDLQTLMFYWNILLFCFCCFYQITSPLNFPDYSFMWKWHFQTTSLLTFELLRHLAFRNIPRIMCDVSNNLLHHWIFLDEVVCKIAFFAIQKYAALYVWPSYQIIPPFGILRWSYRQKVHFKTKVIDLWPFTPLFTSPFDILRWSYRQTLHFRRR